LKLIWTRNYPKWGRDADHLEGRFKCFKSQLSPHDELKCEPHNANGFDYKERIGEIGHLILLYLCSLYCRTKDLFKVFTNRESGIFEKKEEEKEEEREKVAKA
jgi:hypothetical protein